MSLALVGALPGVAKEAMRRLRAEFPSLSEAFVFDGYSYTVSELKESLSRTRPRLAYFCLSSPKQELLIAKVHAASPHTLYIGLGGSLDVYSGRVKRAPKFVRTLHLEWLWRAVLEPKRFLKIPRLFVFLYRVFREKRELLTKKSGG